MKKSVLYILTVLLSLLCVQTSMAQATQDALYIFRNDGQFDAFFFGDIDRIEYSKIDTLGVEQADYVVQEVYALDSVYRIPISAIDSVAFVTPETKIKADVFCPDKSIADYIIASDSVVWIRLATNTPTALIPKVGDKLFIEEESKYLPNGFVGLVTNIEKVNNGYTITTGELEITDVFDRLVAKAAAATPGSGSNARTRGGLFDGAEMEYTTETPIDVIDESGNLSLQGSYTVGKLGPIEISGDVTGNLKYSLKEQLEVRAFLYIDVLSNMFQFDQKTRTISNFDLEASITGSITGSVNFPFKKVSKKLSKYFNADIEAGMFVGAQFNALSLGFKYGVGGEGRSFLVYRDKNWNVVYPTIPDPVFKIHSTTTRSDAEFDINTDGVWSLSTGAYAEVDLGIAYPFKKNTSGPEEKSTGVKVNLRGELGGKLEFDSPVLGFSSDKVVDPLTILDSYEKLNNHGKVSSMGYVKASLSGQLGKKKLAYEKEGDFLEKDLYYLVPNFTDFTIEQDKEEPIRPYRIRMRSSADRDLITLLHIGFAIYDDNGILVADSLCDAYYREASYKQRINEGKNGCVFLLDPGKGKDITYHAYPMVEYRGNHLLAKNFKKTFTLDPARIEKAEGSIYVGDEQGYKEIEVVPNMANMEVKSESDWLKDPIWLSHLNQLTIYWSELPSGTKERRGVIRLTGKSKKGETLVEDSVVVIQSIPYIELTPDKLEFEAAGGTKKVTIGNTNITNISISTTEFTEDYLSASLDGNVITVTMGENTGSEERGARVWVEGKTYLGDAYKTYVTISQKAGKEKEDKPTEDRGDFVIQDSDGESYDRHHQIGWLGDKRTYFNILESVDNLKDLTVTPNQDYIHIIEIKSQKDRTIVNYSCDRNNSSSERNAYFTVSATKADGTQGVSIFYVTQNYSGVSVEKIKKVEFKASLPSSILKDYIKNTDSRVEETKEMPLSKIWGKGYYTTYSGFGAGFSTDESGDAYGSGSGWDVKISASGDNETPIHVVCTRISEGEGVAYSDCKVKATEILTFDLPSGFFEGKVTNLEYTVESSTKQDDTVEECSVKFTASDVPTDDRDSYWGYRSLRWTGKKSEGVVFTKVEGKYHYWHSWSRYSNTYEKTEDKTWTYIPSEDDRLTLDIEFKSDAK